MRYTYYRGLPAVTAWVKRKFTAMSLKKFEIHQWICLLFRLFFSYMKPHCECAMGLF